MNSVKKHALAKHKAERVGLDAAQIAALDVRQAKERQIDELARQIHLDWFPEEYDFMYDSGADYNARQGGLDLSDRQQPRALGKNPMSAEYAETVNQRRQALGVAPLESNGTYDSRYSWQVAQREAMRQLSERAED